MRFIYLFKEKENRKSEVPLHVQQGSSNSGSSGSVPKRYQSVFTEGTPLTSFGIRNDENYTRSHSVINIKSINRFHLHAISYLAAESYASTAKQSTIKTCQRISFNRTIIVNKLELID